MSSQEEASMVSQSNGVILNDAQNEGEIDVHDPSTPKKPVVIPRLNLPKFSTSPPRFSKDYRNGSSKSILSSQTRFKKFNKTNSSPDMSSSVIGPAQRRRPLSAGKDKPYMKNTFSNSQRLTGVKTSITTPPRMKFGKADYTKRPQSPSNQVINTQRKATPKKERINMNVPKKTIAGSAVSMGLGTISAPNYLLTSLEGIESISRGDLRVLYIQNNYLTSFKYLGSQPSLEVIHASNNCITSFYGFEYQPKLHTINLEGNPIARHPHYRLMCLIAGGVQIKKIDNEAVIFREREFVKQFLSSNPDAVFAVRSGWLLDLKPRFPEEYQRVIQEMQSIDMDNREIIRNSDIYKHLVSGSLKVKESLIDDLSLAEIQSSPQRHRPIKTSDVLSTSPSTLAIHQEVNSLKKEISELEQEIKRDKQQVKEVLESHMSIDDFILFDNVEISGFRLSYTEGNGLVSPQKSVIIRVKKDELQFLNQDSRLLENCIQYIKITRTSLLMENDNKLFRLHMRIYGGGVADLVSHDKKKSLSIYKLFHLYISHANKSRKSKKSGVPSPMKTSPSKKCHNEIHNVDESSSTPLESKEILTSSQDQSGIKEENKGRDDGESFNSSEAQEEQKHLDDHHDEPEDGKNKKEEDGENKQEEENSSDRGDQNAEVEETSAQLDSSAE